MSVRPVSVRPVYTDTYTAYTTQPYTNHTHTAKNTSALHTPTQPKTHPHSHTDKTHPQTHTAKNTPPLPHSVRPSGVCLVSVLPVSVFPPSVQPHYCCPSSLQVFILLLVSFLPVSLVSVLHPHGVCPFVTLHHDVVTFNDGVLDQTMVHERTYIMPP